MNEETNSEYFLLNNYKQSSFWARGILLNLDFTSLELIDENNLILKISYKTSEEFMNA